MFLGAAPPASATEEWVLGLARPAYVYLSEGPLPEDDGDVLVIEIDGKAVPTATEQELAPRAARGPATSRAASVSGIGAGRDGSDGAGRSGGVAVHRWSYAYCTLHRARTETLTWLFAGLMGAAAWRPVRRASTSISGSLLEQIIVPGCAASQRTGKVWRYQRGFSMRSIERQTFQQSNDWFPAFEETYGDRFG